MTAPQQPYEAAPGPYGPPAQLAYGSAPLYFPQPVPDRRENGLGIAGMVLGIIGLVLVWVPLLSLMLGILATIFGAVGLNKALKGRATNKGMAIAGLSMGVITFTLGILFLTFMIVTS